MNSNNMFIDYDLLHINNETFNKSIFEYKDKYKDFIYGDLILNIHDNDTFTNDTFFLFRIINIFYSKKKEIYANNDSNIDMETENINSSDTGSDTSSDNGSEEKLNELSDEIYDILNNSDSDSILSDTEPNIPINIIESENNTDKLLNNLEFEDIIFNELSKVNNLIINVKKHIISKDSKNTILLINLLLKMISKINDIEFLIQNSNNLLGKNVKYLKFIFFIQNVTEYVNSHHITLDYYLFKIRKAINENNEISIVTNIIDGIKINYDSLINEEKQFSQFKDVKVNEESNKIFEKIICLFLLNIKEHEEILMKYTGKIYNYYLS